MEAASPVGQAKAGMAVCRGITSLCLTMIAWILTLSAIIGIANDNWSTLNSELGCGLKAAFGLFVCADSCMFFLICWDGANLVILCYTQTMCNCECYHMNFSLQLASFGMLLIGAIIHGTNDPDNINWTFWFCLISALLCLILGIMWKITQKMKRFMKKEASGALEGMGAGAIAGMI
ncbi:Hypothetical predicted protein [Mytilus galloprovincialis]|uniref:Uncharacterized protein n=1 Tax=Mytilus galloprovincialis TaxID=29158 RepID=A0A8B6DU13_MYTGA|nr:Hypothetical predicted protein [Mytilus galloprovincialis]